MAPVALLALALPVLTGCRQDTVRGVEDPDTTVPSTVLSLRVTSGLPTSGVRAVTDKQTDVAPAQDTGEGKINYMQVSMPGLDFLKKAGFVPGGEYTAHFRLLLKESVTTPYAVLVGSQDLGLTAADYRPDKTLGSDRFFDAIHADGFIQTSTSAAGPTTIEPGVTDPTAEHRNVVSVDVERVVAKLQIAQKDGLSLTLPEVGTLSPLTYSMAGSAKETYLFGDHAGSRTLDATGAMTIYKGFKSLVNDKTVDPNNWDPKAGHPFLRRVSDKEGSDYVLGGYYSTPKPVTTATATATSINGGFYFYENSMYGGTTVASKKGEIKYNRIAYAKVYTHLDVIKGWKLTEDGRDIERGTWGNETTNRRKAVPVPFEWYLQARAKHPNWVNDRLYRGTFPGVEGGAYLFEIIDTPKTFYYCEDDGEIFDTARAAYFYYKGFPKNLRKYDGGRMVYMLPLNRQLDATKKFVNYCDTRRNNIYDITIDGIDDIGYNYDPVDPDDPNVPKPEDNPFEPPADPQIPVEPVDYLMRIEAKVLRWNHVEKHFDLWN